MTLNSCRSVLLALWALVSLMPGGAIAQEETSGEDSDSQWLLQGGLDVGRDHSRGVMASVDYTGRTSATAADDRYYDAGFAFSRSQSTAQPTARRPGAETRTTAGDAYVSYGTQRWRGVLGLNAANDAFLRKSKGGSLGVEFSQGGFSARLDGTFRKTVFDTFTLDPAIAARLGITLNGDGTVSCTVTDKGAGARAAYDGSIWGAYASYDTRSFDKVKCAFGFTVPDVFRRLANADFENLGGRFLDRARARVGGRIGDRSRLLKSGFGLGVSLDFWIHWSVDYLRSTDAFGDGSASSYALTGTFSLAPNVSLDATLGSTSGDGGSAPFIGLMLAVGV